MLSTDELLKWIIENNIKSRSVDDEISNLLHTIDLGLLDVEFYKASLSINFDYSTFINIFLNINYCQKHIGRYEVVYTLSADYRDDFIYLEDLNYIRRLADKETLSTEIALAAIQEGLEIEIISKITGLNIEFINNLKNTQ